MPQLPSATDDRTALLDALPTALAARLRDLLAGPVEAASFWAAVVLPFLHVPLLLSGLETTNEVTAFALLIALNVVAVVLGHRYHRD